MEVIRESFVGQLIYYASGRKAFTYPEEHPDFVVPEKYRLAAEKNKKSVQASQQGDSAPNKAEGEKKKGVTTQGVADETPSTGNKVERRQSDDTVVGDGGEAGPQQDGGEDEEDPNLVTWYGPDDPENPQNWSLPKKCWVTFCIMLITISVYMGSSIFSPAIMEASMYFGTSQVVTTLGISLFVAGYGIGPLFLSPITEIPAIGRTPPYIITLALFCILQVPTALVTNFAGFCVLRFLAGFVGSPPLATGGASIQDMFSPHKVPYAMGLYGLAASSGPALAPVVAGFATAAKGWRWAFWEMLWLSGFSLVLLAFTLPETSSINILVKRAQRLRLLTGNENLKSQGEIDQAEMTGKDIALMTLVRPFSMTFTEPILLAINLYIGMVYAILYSYFESFPIVYLEGYGFGPGTSNLPFLALLVGSLISYTVYSLWNKLYFEPKWVKSGGKVKPEDRLPMSCAGAFCFPICLFWFAWTANKTHWISPVIASSFFGIGATWMFMPFLTYLPHAYPEYAASVLASNDFFRSMMGAGMPLAANPLFKNLGISWGNTLLGCLTVLFIPIPFVLIKAGPWLRSKSPRALHDNDDKEEK